MDKLISIKGLVIRTTPVIPDMREGIFPSRPRNLLGTDSIKHISPAVSATTAFESTLTEDESRNRPNVRGRSAVPRTPCSWSTIAVNFLINK